MSVQSQRGRKVTAKKQNPLLVFYGVLGGLVILVAAVVITLWARGAFSTEVSTINAPVGQTAEGFWYKGNPDAAVKVIKYSDFQCPACAFYVKNLAPIVDRDYVETGKIQFIYHEFPLDIHANAQAAGEAGRCAGDQGKFWQMHDMLFANQSQWFQLSSPNNVFSSYAGQIGLNRSTFDSCMSGGTHSTQVTAAGQEAIAANIGATPTFIVNGQTVDINGLIPAIDAALRAAGQ